MSRWKITYLVSAKLHSAAATLTLARFAILMQYKDIKRNVFAQLNRTLPVEALSSSNDYSFIVDDSATRMSPCETTFLKGDGEWEFMLFDDCTADDFRIETMVRPEQLV